MTLTTDNDRGIASTAHTYTFLSEFEDYSTEILAQLSTNQEIPVPEAGEIVEISEESVVEFDERKASKYEIVDKEYRYDVVMPPEEKRKDENLSDTVMVSTVVTVKPVE